MCIRDRAGPISEVRVAKINGEYVVNPSKSSLAEATMEIVVAATLENVMMVEGEAQERSESELIDAIKVGHEAIKVQCQAQLELAQKVGEKATVKRDILVEEVDEELKAKVKSLTHDKILGVSRGALDKEKRKKGFKEIGTEMKESIVEELGEEYWDEK